VRIIGLILLYFSCIFHFLLSALVFGIGAVGLLTSASNLKMRMLPWIQGENQLVWLVVLGLAGMISAALAALGKLRILLVLWSLIALVAMVYGYFIAPYTFTGAAEAKGAAWLSFGALGAFFGALMGIASPRARRA